MVAGRKLAAAVTAGVLAIGLVVVVLDEGGTPAQAAASCAAAASDVGSPAQPAPTGGVAGFDAEQMKNASAIMGAAKSLGLPVAAQLIAIQAAIG